jgi:hypothetical protein
MRVWRRTRTELAGAWRSMRYDLGRRPAEPPADGPDVTSTGMNTFGGTAFDFGPEPIEMPVAGRMPEPRRSPRRAVAVSSLGLLTVVGAAGAYLVVVNGLLPMRDEGPAAAGTVPPATTAAIGRSPRVPRKVTGPTRAAPTPAVTRAVAPPLPPAPRKVSPIRTEKPTNPICCVNPPVPTPTAPASSPSPTTSTPAEPTTSASASGDPSHSPSESPEPRKSPKPGHHRRHR